MITHPKIFIFDDDEDDYLIIEDILKKEFPKAEISWLSLPPPPKEFLLLESPDIIIVDYRLGKINGVDYIKEFREEDTTTGVILLTGLPTSELDYEASQVGASDFISKNQLNPEEFCRSIRFTLESTIQRRKLAEQSAQMESIMEATHMAVWSRETEDKTTLFLSASIEHLSGYSHIDFEEGIINWIDLVPEEDKEVCRQILIDAKHNGKAKGIYKIQKKSGITVWVEEEVKYQNAKDSSKYIFSGTIRDISEMHYQMTEMQLMATTLECASEGILITDASVDFPGPRIVYANKSLEQMTGYSKKELIGKTPRLLQGPETDRETLDTLREALIEGRQFNGITTNYRKDRTPYVVSWSVRPLLGKSGEITHYISTQQDITESFHQQREIAESKKFLQQIGENAKIGGWRYFLKDDFVYWSDQVYAIHEIDSSTNITTQFALDFYSEDFRGKITEQFKNCLRNSKSYILEATLKTGEGREIWVRTTGEPIYENNHVIGAWGTFQDITEWKTAQLEYQTFFSLAIELGSIANYDGVFQRANGAWPDVAGYKPEELIGKSIFDFVHPDDLAKSKSAFADLQNKGVLRSFENRWRHKNGNYLNLLWSVAVDQSSHSLFCICRDISELTLKEQELKEALKQTELANQSKNQFLMVTSHELRTPLNPIIGFSDLLLQEIENSDHKEMLHSIKDSALHLTEIIDDILDISSIELGKTSLLTGAVDLQNILESSVSLMNSKAEEMGLHLELVPSKHLNEIQAYDFIGDSKKIRQILFNLINNAIKFTDSGSVELSLGKFDVSENEAFISVEVKDTGPGIPKEELSLIFDKFHQVSMTAKRRFEGQGLGLSISREFARLMGGDITVKSELGKGSTFNVDFILEALPKDEVKSTDASSANNSHPIIRSDLKILVVEDDRLNQTIMTNILKRLKITVEIAENGLIAVNKTKENSYDLILMDLQMPVMNGFEATQKIREEDTETPIVALSAHALDSVKEECISIGMNAFIEKPIKYEKLNEILLQLNPPSQDS